MSEEQSLPLQFDFEIYNDEELLNKIKDGNNEALEYLINKYKSLVTGKVAKYYIIGAEKDDIIQEGLIGLFKAIKDFKNNKQSSFKSFASLCIERQIITAIKTSNRQKHLPLNSSLSLNNTINGENNDNSFFDIINSPIIEDPLETITKKEYIGLLKDRIDDSLSDFEKKVLYSYIAGNSYTTIAQKLDMPIKSIDNAIQRIRKKATKNLLDEI